MLFSNMFSAWRTKFKEIWEAQLVVDHSVAPAGTTLLASRRVMLCILTLHYLDHNYPECHLE